MQVAKVSNFRAKPFSLIVDDVNDLVISRFILDNQVWEPIESDLIVRLLSPGDRVVDIGANIGYFTVLFSQLVGSHGKVYGFEPETNNFSLLNANVLLNKLDNVTIENLALSDDEREYCLYLSPQNKGDHRISFTAGRDTQNVTSTSLDRYFFANDEKIQLIKSDTQGHELHVLKGMVNVIKRNRDHLCCLLEYSPGLLLSGDGDGVDHLLGFLESLAAEVYWIKEKDKDCEFVLMDEDALRDVSQKMLAHEDQDLSCNIMVFFSAHARIKYFTKIGL